MLSVAHLKSQVEAERKFFLGEAPSEPQKMFSQVDMLSELNLMYNIG